MVNIVEWTRRAVGSVDCTQLAVHAVLACMGEIWELALQNQRTNHIQFHSMHADHDDLRLRFATALGLPWKRRGQQRKKE